MAQAPELSHISTDRDKIWCVKAPEVDVDPYQISSGLVEKPLSYKAFHFYYKFAILLHLIVRKKNHFFNKLIEYSIFSNNNPLIFFDGPLAG